LASTKALVTLPPDHSTDAEWSAHIDDLKKWIAAYPGSATARIALRKPTFSMLGSLAARLFNSVANSSWELFGQRIALAKATLIEAAHLKENALLV